MQSQLSIVLRIKQLTAATLIVGLCDTSWVTYSVNCSMKHTEIKVELNCSEKVAENGLVLGGLPTLSLELT